MLSKRAIPQDKQIFSNLIKKFRVWNQTCLIWNGKFEISMTSANKVFHISKMLWENYSLCTMLKIFPKYLNFENISTNSVRVWEILYVVKYKLIRYYLKLCRTIMICFFEKKVQRRKWITTNWMQFRSLCKTRGFIRKTFKNWELNFYFKLIPYTWGVTRFLIYFFFSFHFAFVNLQS